MTRPAGLAAATAGMLLLAACGGPDGRQAKHTPDRAAGTRSEATASDARQQGDSVAPGPPGSTAALAQRGGMAWHFSRTSRGPKLVYGQRSTDNVRLMLRCPPGGDSVILSFVRPAALVEPGPGELEVISAGANRTLSLESRESRLGGWIVEAVAPIDIEPLQRFRGGAALEIRWGDETIALPAGGAGQDQVRTFFQVCGPTG